LLTESALIAGLGALAGFVLARWIGQTLVAFLNTGSLPVRIVVNLSPDARVFALVAGVAMLVCLLFGLAPALVASRRDPATALQSGDRLSNDGHAAIPLRRALVVVQIAISIVCSWLVRSSPFAG
jgi:hypothetical protein